jgi:Na+-translocating ferredoxin:NAD+ oxidoreductase RnfG subunit
MTARLKEGLRTTGFMFGLTLVVITCVAALHLATAERVGRNAALYLQRAVMEVSGVEVPDDSEAVGVWFTQSVEPEPPAAPVRFRVRGGADGRVIAIVHMRQGRGLWGLITAVIGVNPVTHRFLRMRFLDQNETPGLGARITEAWFLRQIEGKAGPFVLKPEGTRSPAPTEIDAITGATITSVAVRDMLNGLLRDRDSGKEAAK